MASLDALTRTNWEFFAETASSDRTSRTRPRALLAPRNLLDRRRLCPALHPAEKPYRALLQGDLSGPASLAMRPRGACKWAAVGPALRVCKGRARDAASPFLVNDSWDCLEMSSAFPECAGVGSRELQNGFINRFKVEIKGDESTYGGRMAQVGIARIGIPPIEQANEDDDFVASRGALKLSQESTPLLASFLFNSAGDVQTTEGYIELASPGSYGNSLTHRLEDWWSGAPVWWLDSSRVTVQVLVEVDLARGSVSLRMGDWSQEALVFKVPGILDDRGTGRPWVPFVALTSVGQQARILDFHVVTEC